MVGSDFDEVDQTQYQRVFMCFAAQLVEGDLRAGEYHRLFLYPFLRRATYYLSYSEADLTVTGVKSKTE